MKRDTSSSGMTFSQLFGIATVQDVEGLLAQLPEHAWLPVGNPGNYSQINAGSDSADALVEKVTNGMDAIIERAVTLEKGTYDSPRAAVESLFDIPGGHLKDVRDSAKIRQLANMLSVTLRDSGDPSEPTVVIMDRGIGQHPDDFPTTLVSLNEQNKRDKFYLLGAYGWGGAAAYAFSTYCVYISRREPRLLADEQTDEVGWTIVRYNDLADDRTSKTGVYEYLCLRQQDSVTIPRLPVQSLPKELADWSGTACLLTKYQLGRYAGEPTFRASRSLWVLFNSHLFDPVLPFLIRDERPKSISANRASAINGITITGNTTRLAYAARRHQKKAETEVDEDDLEGKGVSYYDSFRATLSTGGTVTVNYWVIAESGNYKRDWEATTRTYVSPEQAVTVTHYGQRHDAYPRTIFEKLSLPALSRFLIVQVDCDELTWVEKRRLFSTTRQRLRETSVSAELRDKVGEALKSDAALRDLDARRRERALSRHSKEQAERIRKLLERAISSFHRGKEQRYRPVTSGDASLPLLNGQPLLDEATPRSIHERPELAEIEYVGDPTFLRVVNAPVRVPAGGQGVVRLELDAPDDYLQNPGVVFMRLITKGHDTFRVEGHSTIKKGTMRCTVSAATAKPGDRGRAIFTIAAPSRPLPLIEEADLIAVDPPQKRAKEAGKGDGRQNGPRVEPVYRDGWPDLGFDEETIAKLVPEADDPASITIYINCDYPPLNERLRQDKRLEPGTVEAFKERFAASMALLTWLEHEDGLDVQQQELRRAAKMYLFSASNDFFQPD